MKTIFEAYNLITGEIKKVSLDQVLSKDWSLLVNYRLTGLRGAATYEQVFQSKDAAMTKGVYLSTQGFTTKLELVEAL